MCDGKYNLDTSETPVQSGWNDACAGYAEVYRTLRSEDD